jgi:hypothetical protein
MQFDDGRYGDEEYAHMHFVMGFVTEALLVLLRNMGHETETVHRQLRKRGTFPGVSSSAERAVRRNVDEENIVGMEKHS